MDELLHIPQQRRNQTSAAPRRLAAQERSWRDRAQHGLNLTLNGLAAARRVGGYFWNRTLALASATRLGWALPILFLLLAGGIGSSAIVSALYTPSYVVSVDGVELGIVLEPSVFEQVEERVEARASAILGYDYELAHTVTYEYVLSEKASVPSQAGFETYLFDRIGDVMKSYVLTIDGEFIGAAADRAVLENILDEMKAPFVNEDTAYAGFVGDVRISYEYTSSDIMQDTAAMRERLTATTSEAVVYTAVSGDTYSGIALRNQMSMDDLMALNPDLNIDRLMIGDAILVRESVPYLSVVTTDRTVYEEAIPAPVERVKDDTMYQGTTKVLEPGSEGSALVTADVEYVNGREQGRTILNSVTLSEPTVKVIAEGTMPRPKTMPKGYFIWPVYGKITSSFGYRSIFGSYSYHSGIDIATAYGTTIVASDGGTVTFSGYQGSYGYLIVIDHGGGTKTYYAHCSKLLVSVGTKVYQGQAIAQVGSTGRSTGNHCHFEIRVNNTPVNPRSYLN